MTFMHFWIGITLKEEIKTSLKSFSLEFYWGFSGRIHLADRVRHSLPHIDGNKKQLDGLNVRGCERTRRRSNSLFIPEERIGFLRSCLFFLLFCRRSIGRRLGGNCLHKGKCRWRPFENGLHTKARDNVRSEANKYNWLMEQKSRSTFISGHRYCSL